MPNIFGQYPMASSTDYAAQTRGTNANEPNERRRIVCYNQPIYEDVDSEGDEWLGLTLSVDRATLLITNVRPMYDQAAILVTENDSK